MIALRTARRRLWVATWIMGACLAGACTRTKPDEPRPLKVTEVLPPEALVRGTKSVQILGENFDPAKPIKVAFGSAVSPRAVVISKTMIHVQVPPGPVGPVDLRVEQPNRPAVVASGLFRYVSDDHATHAEGDAGH